MFCSDSPWLLLAAERWPLDSLVGWGASSETCSSREGPSSSHGRREAVKPESNVTAEWTRRSSTGSMFGKSCSECLLHALGTKACIRRYSASWNSEIECRTSLIKPHEYFVQRAHSALRGQLGIAARLLNRSSTRRIILTGDLALARPQKQFHRPRTTLACGRPHSTKSTLKISRITVPWR